MCSKGQSLIIDPFISGNPNAKTTVNDVQVEYVLLTHGHEDHILNAEQIAKANDASIVSNVELATYIGWKNLKFEPMNIDGQLDFPYFKAKLIQAFHSSSNILDDEKKIIYLGNPAGYIIEIEGKTILHTGDTSLYEDMKLIGQQYSIDLAFLPIGDRFTMGIDHAAQAAEWINPKFVVPIHYSTFPFIAQDAKEFVKKLSKKGIKGLLPDIGKTFSIK